jgi:hypothetical protein
MLVEQQIAERRERARDSIAKILERPSNGPFAATAFPELS